MSLAGKLGVTSTGGLADRLGVGQEPDETMGPPDALLQEGAMLQEQNDAMNFGERTAVSMGRGFENAARGAQSLAPLVSPPPRDPAREAAYGDLEQRYPGSTLTGEIIGESAPFLPAGLAVFGSSTGNRVLWKGVEKLLPRLLATAGLGGAEAGIIAAGREGNVPASAVVGGLFSFGMELVGPLLYRAGRSLVREALGKEPTEQVINEAGDFSGEVIQAAEEAGISPDELIDDVIDLAVQSPRVAEVPAIMQAAEGSPATMSEVEEVFDRVKKGNESDLASAADPDPDILQSAENLGLEDLIPASAVSRNRAFQETEQALKADPSTGLSNAEASFVTRLKEEADKTITMFEGSIDKGAFQANVADDFQSATDKLYNMSEVAYDRIAEMIPPTTMASTDATESYVLQLLNNYGGPEAGEKFLSAAEKRVLALVESGEVTYAALDKVRKDIGAAIGKKQGPFKDEEVGGLKKLYESLTADQESIAEYMGAGAVFSEARDLTRQRKRLEDRMVDLFGKNLDQGMITKLESGVDALGRGDMMKLKKMMDALPADRRQEAAASLLNRMFTSGARNQSDLSQGFVGFYERLNRSPKVKDFFFKYLPEEARQRMDDIFAVSKGFYTATGFENKSNTARTALINFEKGGWLDKLYGSSKAAGAAEITAQALGIPIPSGTAGSIAAGASALASRGDSRSVAADKLLRSPKFRAAMKAAAQQSSAKEADDALRTTAVFREWIELQPKTVATSIASTGFIPWLLREEDDAETK